MDGIVHRVTKSLNGHHQKIWRECGVKGNLLHYWWESKLIQPLWRILWRFLKRLGIKLPYYSIISLLGIYPEETITKKFTFIPIFIVVLYNS